MPFATVNTAEILILLYIIITFGYSAMEKSLQWNKSIAFYKNHFKATFLKNYIPFLVFLVVLLEFIIVLTCILGVYFLYHYHEQYIGFYGLVLTAITLIGLMIGQRIAQDYSGAMNITVYFILTVIGVYLMQ